VTRKSSPRTPARDPGWGARFLGLDARRLVLASASPRRAILLEDLGIDFEIRTPDIAESRQPGEAPEALAVRLALAKARSVLRPGEDAIVVGADTIVVLDQAVLGKPADADDARRMLRRLSGRTHRVLSGVAVILSPQGREAAGVAETQVRFRSLRDEEIGWMVASGEAADKAGAYGIQGLGSLAVESIDGDYWGVVGLPLNLLRQLIGKAVSE
jgi:septum formation protein